MFNIFYVKEFINIWRNYTVKPLVFHRAPPTFKLKLNGEMVAFADNIAIRYVQRSCENIVIKMNSDFETTGNPIIGQPGIVYHAKQCLGNFCDTNCIKIEYICEFK